MMSSPALRSLDIPSAERVYGLHCRIPRGELSVMWLQMYRAARAVLHHPGQFTQQPISQLVRNLLLNLNLLSDRVYMRKSILPLLASTGLKRVLFVGCKSYTSGYGKRLSRISIDYWTTDIDPQAAMWGEKD